MLNLFSLGLPPAFDVSTILQAPVAPTNTLPAPSRILPTALPFTPRKKAPNLRKKKHE